MEDGLSALAGIEAAAKKNILGMWRDDFWSQ